MENNVEKDKAVQMAMSQIEKQFGKGSIMKLGGRPIESIPVIRSGSLALDKALGVGGYPRGRVIEIYGPESSGKTTLALHAVAEAQKADGIAAFIDTTITSPQFAIMRPEPPSTFIHITLLAPELSATPRELCICIII